MNFGRRTILALALWIGLVSVSDGEVIELKTGVRLEGTLKQVTPAGVVVEVGGETLTILPERIRAIYFESAPSEPSQPSARGEAMNALKDLQAVTRGRLTFTEYAPRVKAAQLLVDRYLQEPPAQERREVQAAIGEAMHYYVLAATAWNARVRRADYSIAGADPIIDKCPELKRVVDDAYTERVKSPAWRKSAPTAAMTAYYDGEAVATHLPVVWSCAANRIAEAERLMPAK